MVDMTALLTSLKAESDTEAILRMATRIRGGLREDLSGEVKKIADTECVSEALMAWEVLTGAIRDGRDIYGTDFTTEPPSGIDPNEVVKILGFEDQDEVTMKLSQAYFTAIYGGSSGLEYLIVSIAVFKAMSAWEGLIGRTETDEG